LQLQEYWNIVRRRLWLVLLLPAIAMAASGYTALRGSQSYCSNMKLSISVVPITGYAANPQYDPQYFATLTSEYLADDLTELVKSNPFAQWVSAELGYSLDPGLIVAATRAKKTHRTIDMSVCGSNPGTVGEVGDAYARVVNTRLPEFFTQLQAQNAVVRIVNGPSVGRASSVGSMAAEVLLRTLLGLALGLALAFLLDYLDDRLRDRRELERLLELPILAEVPRQPVAARRS
jgi:capsular polysaccharide biosynthesis protein